MAKIAEFNRLGQSIWCDYLRRAFLTSGEFQALVDQGVSGVTSNPTIFEKAIAGSTDYDSDLRRLVEERKSIREIYETLVLEDISKTADILRPVFNSTGGQDGFVSMEVDPELANDSRGMVDEARRFFKALNRPNVMIKIPATEAGIPAIRALISEGINVNVTLIFSVKQYENSAEAYISGLEELSKSREDLSGISSVASFFVSRVDTKVDKALDEKKTGQDLKGKIGIANAKMGYQKFHEIFQGPRWEKLKKKGAKVQKVLWGSTSTKNPAYPDTLYVDNLVGPDTVNTLPPETIKALQDHGVAKGDTLDANVEEAKEQLARLAELGIDLDQITEELEDEGVEKFSKSITSLFEKISQKKERMVSEPHSEPRIKPASFNAWLDTSLRKLGSDSVVRRMWNRDYTIWKPAPEEISNRLGWLDAPGFMEEQVEQIEEVVDKIKADGYTRVLLLGMGGSSLAPITFAETFGTAEGSLELSVLDTTEPKTVESTLRALDLEKTLFIVSSKSGKTVETLSLFRFFYNKELENLRNKKENTGAVNEDDEKRTVGQHFIVITDPGSPLESLADQNLFRAKFLNDPNIGGRYSALSYFGLIPAALIGVDLHRLLDNALTMASACEAWVEIKDNPGAWLGAILGDFPNYGRNKLTLVTSAEIASLGPWVEQLIAESTGKEGKGILPVVGETLGAPGSYQNDRLFIVITLRGDHSYDTQLRALENAGFPVVRLNLRDRYELGGQFFQWEFATAVAGYFMGINPFNQPDVESSKEQARRMVSSYVEKGTLPPEEPVFVAEGMQVFGRKNSGKEKTTKKEENVGEVLMDFIEANLKNDSYIALQAYLEPTYTTNNLLSELRIVLRDDFRLATTLGYGPRFLHSTGQLHKGDAGSGVFVQFTSASSTITPKEEIPEVAGLAKSSLDFGTLTAAEALGDRKTLEARGRNVIRIDLGKDANGALQELLNEIRRIPIEEVRSAVNKLR